MPETTFRSTPAASAGEAVSCLRSCGRTGGSPAPGHLVDLGGDPGRVRAAWSGNSVAGFPATAVSNYRHRDENECQRGLGTTVLLKREVCDVASRAGGSA